MFTPRTHEHTVGAFPSSNGIRIVIDHRIAMAPEQTNPSTDGGTPGYPRGLQLAFLAHTVVALVFALTWLLVPARWASIVNWEPFDPAITRLFGAIVLALVLSSWLAYRASTWEAVRIKTQLEVALTSLGALTGLYEILVGGAPTFMWAPTILLAIFAVAYIYFYRQATAQASPSDPAAA